VTTACATAGWWLTPDPADFAADFFFFLAMTARYGTKSHYAISASLIHQRPSGPQMWAQEASGAVVQRSAGWGGVVE